MDGFPYVALLKACAKNRDLCKGSRLHAAILRDGLVPERTPHLATGLISMYAKCGMFENAQDLIQNLSSPHVVPWNALISGYVQNGKPHQAINHFEHMQREGLFPNAVTFICILKACGSIGAIGKGKQIHEKLMNLGLLEKDVVLGTALVDMYAKCGNLAKAQEVLEQLPVRDAVTWNALITGYTQQGRYCRALDCFELMRNEGLSPDEVTFLSVLKACGSTRAIDKGKQINDEILRTGFLGKGIAIGTALVDMYAKCGALAKAQEVLEGLPNRNVVTWSTLIEGYTQQGQGQEAIKCFDRMHDEGLLPDAITFICVLKACGSTRSIEKGQKVHEEAVTRGYLNKDVALATALIDMYAKCGMLAKAQLILEELHIRDSVTWNAIIGGHVQEGQGHKAVECFERMQSEGHSPNAITFLSLLKACCSNRDIDKGKQIHREIVSRGLLKKDIVLGNALVDMYAQCSMLTEAQKVLQELPIRDIVSWNSLISGYAQQGQGHEALICLELMEIEGLLADNITYLSILKSCGCTGSIDKGKHIHDDIVRKGLLKNNSMLGNALVGMYVKCGILTKAQKLLEEFSIRNIVSWNTLIAGHAQEGQGQEALKCFQQLKLGGLSPNEVTLLSILTACSHSGLLDEAQVLLTEMMTKYGITPNVEHHTCMVFAYGNAGLFHEAMLVIKAMPSDYPVVWIVLLGACKKWGNVDLGRLAFDQVLQLDDSATAAYILMAEIFAAAGMQEDAVKVESMRPKICSLKEAREAYVWKNSSGNVKLVFK